MKKNILFVFLAVSIFAIWSGICYAAYDFFPPSENATIGKKRAWSSVKAVKFETSDGYLSIPTTLTTNAVDVANSIWGASNSIVAEGASANAHETTLTFTDPTADVLYQFPTGTAGTYYPMVSTLATNQVGIANSVWGASGSLVAEGATADASEISLSFADATADVVYNFPDQSVGTYYPFISTTALAKDGANSIWWATNSLLAEGATADAFETYVTFEDPTADSQITFPADTTGYVGIQNYENSTSANVLTALECGKTIVLNSATEFQTTLPDISTTSSAWGCRLKFIVGAAASAADYTIITGNSLENVIQGHVNVAGTPAACADEDTITLVDGNSVGDYVELFGNGTSWFITGTAVTAAKLTCTQAD